MSFEVAVGGERKQFEKRKALEKAMAMIGTASKTIYLNGGTETRAYAREFWRQYAADLGISFLAVGGCIVKIGYMHQPEGHAMTYLAGKITTKKGAHRLNDNLNNFLINLSALCTAYEVLQHGRAYRDFLPGHNATIDSYQFDMKVKVPDFEPLPVAMAGKYPDAIEIEFLKGRESPRRVGDPVPFQVVLINLLAPIFVQFFEDHKTWLDANIGSPDIRPAVLNFGRVIRNSPLSRW